MHLDEEYYSEFDVMIYLENIQKTKQISQKRMPMRNLHNSCKFYFPIPVVKQALQMRKSGVGINGYRFIESTNNNEVKFFYFAYVITAK